MVCVVTYATAVFVVKAAYVFVSNPLPVDVTFCLSCIMADDMRCMESTYILLCDYARFRVRVFDIDGATR